MVTVTAVVLQTKARCTAGPDFQATWASGLVCTGLDKCPDTPAELQFHLTKDEVDARPYFGCIESLRARAHFFCLTVPNRSYSAGSIIAKSVEAQPYARVLDRRERNTVRQELEQAVGIF